MQVRPATLAVATAVGAAEEIRRIVGERSGVTQDRLCSEATVTGLVPMGRHRAATCASAIRARTRH
jgi:hypothetical protein